jgi:hypothetical protein
MLLETAEQSRSWVSLQLVAGRQTRRSSSQTVAPSPVVAWEDEEPQLLQAVA